MHATRTLPPGYQEHGAVDLKHNTRLLLLLNLLSLPLLALASWLAFLAVRGLRPDITLEGSFSGGTLLLAFVIALVLIALVIVVHELIHGLFFWLFTGERPLFGFQGLYAYAAAPDWYIPRNQYMVVGLAPLVLISLGGLLLLPVLPALLVPGLLLMVVFNAAGAVGDIMVVGWLLFQPRGTLARDVGDAVTLYRPGPA